MRWHRYLSPGLALVALVGVTAALARPSVHPPPVAAPDAPEDFEAAALLDRAAASLTPERIAWLSCTIHQKVDLPGLHYESKGRYLLAPGHRFRLEVHTRGAGAPGTLLWVSDGADVWQAARAGEGSWQSVSRLSLAEVFAAMGGATAPPRLRSEFLNGPTFGGVGPLLRTLRSRLRWIHHEAASGQMELTGAWPSETLRELAPPERPWPAGLPRLCRVSLEARSLWPSAVEWWGPGAGGEGRLARTEYHDPVFNQPLPPEVCGRAFAFDPGAAPVSDRTGQVTADVAARAQQLAAER
jgi:hypothetical protein